MEALFNIPRIKNHSASMQKSIQFYAERRAAIKASRRDDKTQVLNEIDEALDIECSSFFNILMSELITNYPLNIKVRNKDGIDIVKDFWQWYQFIPASTKYHDVENGGLYDHCRKQFFNWIKSLAQTGSYYPVERACLVSLAHDFCKLTCYYYGDDKKWHNLYPETYHHAKKSLELLHALGINTTPDVEALILMHMSGFQNEEDKLAMSLEAKNWLFDLDNMQIMQLLNIADQR